jgi:hypothetical protein
MLLIFRVRNPSPTLHFIAPGGLTRPHHLLPFRAYLSIYVSKCQYHTIMYAKLSRVQLAKLIMAL